MNLRPSARWWLLLALVSASGAASSDSRETELRWIRQHLPPVPEWTEWQQRTGALPPDFCALPRRNRLPDPLRFEDGREVATPAEWVERRREILRLFERDVTGSFPPQPPLDGVTLLHEVRGDGYRTRDVRLQFGGDRAAGVRVRVTRPDGPGPFPTLVAPGLASAWPPRLIRRGYVSVGYAGSDRDDDAAALSQLYPEHDFALLARRAWLVPVVMDYLETLPEVNPRQVALFGYSRDGKMAALATALEPRVAALIAGSTGVGGFLPWRHAGERGGGESIESTTRMFPEWFAPQLRFFSGREDRLPVDGNLLLALCAPRPVLVEYGLNDEVSNAWGIEQSVDSVRPVYRLLGSEHPPSLLLSPGFHGGIDPERCLDWLDGVFGRTTQPWQNVRLHDWDFEAWRSAHGAKAEPPPGPEGDVAANVRWMLGKQPPQIPTTGRRAAPTPFPARPLPPGPTEVAKGGYGNPGQVAPDVASWVISRGGQEFGWLEPHKSRTDSRRLRFGANLEGHLYYPAGTTTDARLPVVIWLHGYHYPLGYMWVYRRDLHPILALTEAGFAVLAFDQAGFGTRAEEARTFPARYPEWSLLGRMVEDVRAAIDALEEEAMVDASRVSLLGYTLGGTVALHAALLDPRVQQVVSIAGFTPLRSDRSAAGLTGLERYYRDRPLLPRMGLIAAGDVSLPYDYEDLVAEIPARMLVVQPRRDRDSDGESVRAAVGEAQRRRRAGPSTLELDEPDDYARLTSATQTRVIEWMRRNLSAPAP